MKRHSGLVISGAFSPDNKYLATGSSNNTIKLWSIKSFKEVATLKGHKREVFYVEFSTDCKVLYSCS
jgi:WD40 repeat protein